MINGILKDAKKIIRSKKFNEFGKLLHESWLAKRSLSSKVTNHKIDKLYNYALESGADGGKLLGAGGGGFFVFYVKRNNQKKFIKNIQQHPRQQSEQLFGLLSQAAKKYLEGKMPRTACLETSALVQ